MQHLILKMAKIDKGSGLALVFAKIFVNLWVLFYIKLIK